MCVVFFFFFFFFFWGGGGGGGVDKRRICLRTFSFVKFSFLIIITEVFLLFFFLVLTFKTYITRIIFTNKCYD